MTHLLTALLALATGWCWGHLTARIHTVLLVAGTPGQDDTVLTVEEAEFIARTSAAFDELVDGLDLNDPKDEAA